MKKRLLLALQIFPALRYIKEWVKWKWHGGNYRYADDIEEIWLTCSGCEHVATIDDEEFQCTKCMCFIHRYNQDNFNKAAWNTTKCPLTPPKWD